MWSPGLVSKLLAWGMLVIWIVFAATFLLVHPRKAVSEVRRAQGWWLGLVLQVFAYAIAWVLARPFGTSHRHVPVWLELALALSAILIAVTSAWMVIDSVRTLGKQFSVPARIVSGHELVRNGPFAVVRHPIYSGLLGLLIATAVAFSSWLGLILSIALYLVGTSMRIRKEERLLRDEFGAEYDAYAREVPALVPGLF